ncbi:hypothetical protein [Mycobacterium scrofulaceum]|uniref:hypothetical protein n=1 Tax=Mycobacterium scrofulaceum TaxID=1783 RepID=UPI00114F7BFE|nr:hypothetical protein [Mycobacterium scrofulaceum]
MPQLMKLSGTRSPGHHMPHVCPAGQFPPTWPYGSACATPAASPTPMPAVSDAPAIHFSFMP